MAHTLTLSRRTLQGGILLLIVLLPLFDLVRIDVARGRFVLMGYQIWWSDFFIVYPFWIMTITLMATFYTVFGMVFCGWGCPQNTLSEFADKLIKKMIGRKATAGVGDLESGTVTHHPDKKKNWVLLILIFAGVSLVLGFVGAFYFMAPGASWSFSQLPDWVWLVTFMIAAVVFLDLILIRHFWCKYVCPYGLYQYLFHHPRTMRVAFDEARQTDCIGCNRCTDSCFMGVEPRLVKVYTRCINCGDCITACDEVAAKKSFKPLLNFTFARDEASHTEIGSSVFGRVFWPSAIFTTAACLFAYGVMTYQSVHLRVSPVAVSSNPSGIPLVQTVSSSAEAGGVSGSYVVEIFNKSPHPQEWTLGVSGFPEDAVVLSRRHVTLAGGASERVVLQIREGRIPLHSDTPYPFQVTAQNTQAPKQVLSEYSVFYSFGQKG
ncbi:MAG: 4Fe-4S binding protein [Nitrospirae bacterium]|nr:4Fe-4S binding protein [Nitrospirota bacterium]